ncbi:vitamin B12-dependent ribonucleotide reductase [Candidatus Parcubacteria bacterium]|nr:vitamin B12-dependent ribonucleotide reductase [Candidatus Parcubacteria bacterium]MBI4099003.1 vitamin B12-dependent ribonucleotide reductase [Candidatus Parcubacteria bacterium]MBI4385680.1 vitamin B12-dependent ribonucleotide reductase [Candidatus Parcubacteria bacterium]
MTSYHPGAIQAKRPQEAAALSGKGRGLALKRFFTSEGSHPFDEIAWDRRMVKVHRQGTVLEDAGLEFPDFWSQNSANITAAKYFRGKRGSPERETSVRQMVGRVAKTIRGWGEELGYFATNTDADVFEEELSHILVMQRAAFNSPVWFNVGVEPRPQCSACFILKVEDTMTSILDWIRTEGMIFKGGSGAGINLSTLRSSREGLSRGGQASGPVSFMRGADSVAGMIASGGATRRAAKMVVLNADHPDIAEFVRCKAEEEKKARALMAAGYDMADINNEGWKSIQYQNANNSVRVSDSFMRAVEVDGAWQTRFVNTGEVADEYRARDLLKMIAQAAWECGDPGMQFDTTINGWHTCPHTGPITASNPCSEYMSLDNSACNLASINLMKFLNEDGTFAVEAFQHTVRVMILAQDIIVDGSSYPTPEITKNAKAFRQLGLGYANLGALLMTLGLPYDSAPACAWAGAITALLCAEAYRYSAEIAAVMGPYEGYRVNREPQLKVIEKHRDALAGVPVELIADEDLVIAATQAWDEAVTRSREHGVRNSQVTVIAPTGTIALMMDCDTTGVEPAFALVTSKQLVGGGTMKFVNQSVPAALRRLGYDAEAIERIVAHIEQTGTIEGAADLKGEHVAVFDCAVKPANGARAISWQGHVRMVAAAQPFISGSLSKTFNMSVETTPDEIMEAYLMAWNMGLKCFAVYRDGSKAAQPLATASGVKPATQLVLGVGPTRRKLPPTRKSETHRFVIAGHKGYLTYSMYEDGAPAEIFIQISKHGGALAGLLGSFAITVSMALQYGVPLKELARKFVYGRYEPSGVTENPDIRIATSITDYIFRYLALRFLAKEDQEELGMASKNNGNGNEDEAYPDEPKVAAVGVPLGVRLAHALPSAPSLVMPAGVTYADTLCRLCGGMMIQTGSCKTCLQCGEASGGCS